MTDLMFPVGHYLGEYQAGDDGLSAGFQLRIGDRTVALEAPTELTTWVLAHQRAESPLSVAVTKALGFDAHGILDRLIDKQALARVESGSKAEEFARRHRLRPLQLALGQASTDASAGFALGRAGVAAIVVDPLMRDLWWWAGPSPDLWTLCRRLAVPGVREAEQVLDHFLHNGHALLAAGAAYLDVA